MDSNMFRSIQEAYLDVYTDEFLYENTPTGKSKRASRGGIAQRPTLGEIKELKAAAKRKPQPIVERNPRQQRIGIGLLPSRGVGPTEALLRGGYRRQPKGIATARLSKLKKESRNASLPTPKLLNIFNRIEKMKAAMSRSQHWGTPEAAAEGFILEYLMQEGYADCLGSAEIIFENMSDEWLDDILEGRTLKSILGPGSVADYSSQNLRTPSFISKQQQSAEGAMRPITKLQGTTYQDRVNNSIIPNASRIRQSDNPNYQGPLTGGGSGTKDRMPGTTPSSSVYLPRPGTKFTRGTITNPRAIPLNRSKNYI